MAINEQVLGPNSSLFVISASDTIPQILDAMNAYVTAHGWELYDAVGTLSGYTAGRVWRTLQEGSTTVYKYVQIAMSAGGVILKVYESWNPTTHVGTNDATFYNNTTGPQLPFVVGVDGTAFILFVNQKWLAIRARSHLLVHSVLTGAFEIKKDFGEAESHSSNIYMTSYYPIAYNGNANGVGFFGSPRSVTKNVVGQAACNLNTISTPYGVLSVVYGTYQVNLNNMLPASVPNGTLTMTACENASGTANGIEKIRGRIFGIKLVYGAQVWNDMDLAQVKCDENLFQSVDGTITNHHIINVQQGSYARFVIPV